MRCGNWPVAEAWSRSEHSGWLCLGADTEPSTLLAACRAVIASQNDKMSLAAGPARQPQETPRLVFATNSARKPCVGWIDLVGILTSPLIDKRDSGFGTLIGGQVLETFEEP